MSKSKISEGSNLMWEGSRMILPEHRAALKQYNYEKQRIDRPMLDEQYLQDLEYMLKEAQQRGRLLRITVFGEFGSRTVKCKITSIDNYRGQLIVSSGYDSERISIKDIIGIG